MTAQGSVRLRVSAAGRHLKGFVDDALVVHGHRPAGAPGLVGLLVDGRGRVVLPAPFAIDGDANSVDPEHAAGAQSPHDHGAHAH
ncbi:MAG: hypothetical protein D6738_03245 [Acidobacteria bacterium]|nr:MAG: hypothetical protein D6738_03245 [Acidobacteriota bacterium]